MKFKILWVLYQIENVHSKINTRYISSHIDLTPQLQSKNDIDKALNDFIGIITAAAVHATSTDPKTAPNFPKRTSGFIESFLEKNVGWKQMLNNASKLLKENLDRKSKEDFKFFTENLSTSVRASQKKIKVRLLYGLMRNFEAYGEKEIWEFFSEFLEKA